MTGYEEGLLTLDDESADTSVPDNLKEEFEAKWDAFNAEAGEEEAAAKVGFILFCFFQDEEQGNGLCFEVERTSDIWGTYNSIKEKHNFLSKISPK